MFFDVAKLPEHEAPAPATRYARILFDDKVIPEAPLSMAVFRFEPGQIGPKHRHETEVEVYFCLEGRGVVVVDGVEHELTPRTALYIAPQKDHETRNAGDGEFIFLAVFGPCVNFDFIRNW